MTLLVFVISYFQYVFLFVKPCVIKTWNKKVGDKVKPGDVLCGIETDKAVVDFEMQEEGYVAKLLYPAGAKDVKLGELIAILVDKESDIAAFANFSGQS